jgi:hypothetical protein
MRRESPFQKSRLFLTPPSPSADATANGKWLAETSEEISMAVIHPRQTGSSSRCPIETHWATAHVRN